MVGGVTVSHRGGGPTAQSWQVRGRQARQEVQEVAMSSSVKKDSKSISDTGKNKNKGTDS